MVARRDCDPLAGTVAATRDASGQRRDTCGQRAIGRRVVEPRYGKAKADRILARCWDLENLTSVTDLIRLFD